MLGLSITGASSMTTGARPFFLGLSRFSLRFEFLGPYAQLLSDRISLGARHQQTTLPCYPSEEFCGHLPMVSSGKIEARYLINAPHCSGLPAALEPSSVPRPGCIDLSGFAS